MLQMKLDLRIVSPLEKVFPDEAPKGGFTSLRVFRNERASFQIAWRAAEGESREARSYVRFRIDADIPVRLRRVRCVPVTFPTFPDADDNYLRKEPGLYPDALEELPSDRLRACTFAWDALWADAKELPAGDHPIRITAVDQEGNTAGEGGITLHVTDAVLPPQKLRSTKWFHSDCLCERYGVKVWSEAYWEICERYIRAMAEYGINMLLTPVHTPPLDTEVGGERMTCQLVDITVNGDGTWSFGFDRLRRWVETATRCGIEWFEIAHLFTQWGATHAPKIVANVNGEEKRIFGWETDATGPEYSAFLKAYLPALTGELRRLGIADRCYFHISDEPNITQLESYRAAKELAAPLLEGFPMIDALSDFGFYRTGAVEHPVPAINHMDPFVAADVKDLWTYYCIGQYKDVSNMFVAMPSLRNRILGVMLYKYKIAGFLQWGYNFWNAQGSICPIDPWVDTDCGGFTPAGDAYQVYPGRDGGPVISIRMEVTAQAFCDLRALQLLEERKGRDFVLSLIREELGEVTWTEYTRDPERLLAFREKVDLAIAGRG